METESKSQSKEMDTKWLLNISTAVEIHKYNTIHKVLPCEIHWVSQKSDTSTSIFHQNWRSGVVVMTF